MDLTLYGTIVALNLTQVMHGRLTRSELQTVQNDCIKEAQNCLKQLENFEQLKVKFGVIEKQGITKCVGRLSN